MQGNTQEKSRIKQNILHYLRYKGISEYRFYKESGITRGVLQQPNGISEDNISRFLDYAPDVNIRWLMTGDGEILTSQSIDDISYPTDMTGIPLLPINAMAGFFTGEVSVDERDCERLNIPGLKADFVVPVSGDSMEPKYFSGDMVACQMVNLSDIFFQWGKIYVIDTTQGVLLKKVKKGTKPDLITLISENPEYDNLEIPRSNVLHIALVKGLVRIV